MSEHQVNDNTKGRAQDYLGLVLCAFGGFGAVSVLMQFFGSETPKLAVLKVFTASEGLLGVFPAFLGLLGMAALGSVLFLRSEAVDAGRHLLGILGIVLGAALLFGGLHPTYGGTIGGAVTSSLGGSLLGKALSILLGFFVVGASCALSWGVWLKPLLANVGEFISMRRATATGPEGGRVAPSDRTEPDAEGVTAAEAEALVPAAKVPPRRSDPFEPTITAPPQTPQSAPRAVAPKAAADPVSAPSVAAPSSSERSLPAPSQGTSSPQVPEADIHVTLPKAGTVEQISRALKKAAASQSRSVPPELRGPNPADDVRLGGGIPEGAKPLEGADRGPVLRPKSPQAEEIESPEAGLGDVAAGAVDGGVDGPPTEVPQGAQPAGADDLLAEIQAASERLKALEEEATQPIEPAPPRRGSYWSRGEEGRGPRNDPHTPDHEEGSAAASWEGNTWRPSWESAAEDAGSHADPETVPGPKASWESDPAEAPVDVSELKGAAAPSVNETAPVNGEEDPQTEEEYEDEEEVFAEEEGEYEAEAEEDEEEYEDGEVWAEDDEEDEYEEEEEEEEEEEDAEYEDEDEEVYAEDEEYEEEEGEDEEYEEEEGEEAEYEDEEVWAEDEDDAEEEAEVEQEELEEVHAAEDTAADDSGTGSVSPAPDVEAIAELTPEPPPPQPKQKTKSPSKTKSKGKTKAEQKVEQEAEVQADLFGAQEAAPETPKKAPKKASKRTSKKSSKKSSKKAEPEPDPEPQVVLQPQPAEDPESAAADPKGSPEPAPEAGRPGPPTTVPSGVQLEPSVWGAGNMFLEENRVAVSMLQRRYAMDFDEACQILDKLQEIGLIGPYLGGKTRDILLDREEWEAVAKGVPQS